MVGLRFMSDCGRDMLQERYRELLQLVQCGLKFVSLNFGEPCFLYCRITNLPVSAGTFLKSGILANGRYPWLGNQVMFSGCLYHYYCVHRRHRKIYHNRWRNNHIIEKAWTEPREGASQFCWDDNHVWSKCSQWEPCSALGVTSTHLTEIRNDSATSNHCVQRCDESKLSFTPPPFLNLTTQVTCYQVASSTAASKQVSPRDRWEILRVLLGLELLKIKEWWR